MTSDEATPTCTSIASATDRALARRILCDGPQDEHELALVRAAAIIAAYRAEEVREAVGHAREVVDAYRREAVARGDRKTIAWIDRCLADVENREEKL